MTQVPAVVGMVSETFSDVYPRPGDGPPKDFAKLQLARGIMKGHRHVFGVGDDAVFDEHSFVIENSYTGGSDNLKKTFDEAPKHRDDAYNTFCKERLDYQRGDDFLQIGKIDLNAVRRYITRTVPRELLAGVSALTAMSLVAANRASRRALAGRHARVRIIEAVEDMSFSYAEFTGRNLGFVTADEQATPRRRHRLRCGTGGMGGAAILALVRAGVGRLVIADIDDFEISNLNRQVFCTLGSIGRHKAEATRRGVPRDQSRHRHRGVARGLAASTSRRWLARRAIVVNGTDDLSGSLLLYRTARAAGKAVIDAYASPLPSVYVTRPNDPMPEERLGYPTIGTAWNAVTPDQRAQAFLREAEYVMLHSSSRHHVDLALGGRGCGRARAKGCRSPRW